MRRVPEVSLSEGARLTGRSKGTLSKAVSSGKMSVVSKSDNGYLIDTSELFRVFPPKQSQPVVQARLETPSETAETKALRVEVELLRERVSDLASDRDAWRDQAQKLLLAAPVATVSAPSSSIPEEVASDVEEEVSQPRGWRFWKRG